MTRRTPSPVRLSRLWLSDLLAEATAGLVQRPARSALTMLGSVLGVAAFVAILGITATAAGQVSQSFNALTATTVSVGDAAFGREDSTGGPSFTPDARQRVRRLAGVVDAGTYFRPEFVKAPRVSSSLAAPTVAGLSTVKVAAVDPGIFAVSNAKPTAGRVWDRFAQSRALAVAVLGEDAARALNITRLNSQPVVFINDRAFVVMGILHGFDRLPELSTSVMIPTTTSLKMFGKPADPGQRMVIQTRLGAAQLIARQAALALRPDSPQVFAVTAPADPKDLKEDVTSQLNSLFLLLAAISLVIGAVGIANTTLVSVMERTQEVGLRRALGARPRHIALQFLAESAALGTLGGLLGGAIGVTVTVATAVSKEWTPVMAPWSVFAAPAAGALVGIVAGLYPAMRAARIEPAEALRR
jgi:putative ABC transport system permease protein